MFGGNPPKPEKEVVEVKKEPEVKENILPDNVLQEIQKEFGSN